MKPSRCRPGCLAFLLRAYLVGCFAALFAALVVLVRSCLRQRPPHGDRDGAHTVPDWAFRQPDPLIYSQYWLTSQGLAVTWQNPDIQLFLASAPSGSPPVSAWSLAPGTLYRVVAQVWNGSPFAPVADLPVHLSYLDFGIGGVSVPITTTAVDLPVKGAVGSPAVATVDWRTPETPGHYCLQVRLEWPYDANPDNNLGQHNVQVQPFNSPRATFTVPVRNDRRVPLAVALRADAYEIPRRRPCPPGTGQPVDPETARRRVLVEHGTGHHDVPEGWRVDLGRGQEPLQLAPGETVELTVTVEAPDGFSGRQAFNLNGFAGPTLLGGVTLVAEGNADD